MTSPCRHAAAAAVLLVLLGCGRDPESASPGGDPGAQPESTGQDAVVAGTLAPSLAPPSAIVVLEPQDGVEVPVKTEPAVIDQAGSEFVPAFLLAQTGQAVEFRNGEDVLHNVRVTEVAEHKPVFNISTPPFGKFEYRFQQPGLYNVGCDIHSTMRADILVTATPYTDTTDSQGSFTITDVTPGRYNLIVYAGKAPVVRSIEVKSGRTDLGLIQ